MSESRKLRVFLCHSSNDKPAVRELYQRLKAEGWIDPWLDEEKLYPGQDWNLEIEKAVESADAILVCLSNNSVTKEGYVQRELRIVLDIADYKPEGTLFVIPVRLEDCEPPRRLRVWHYADYFSGKDRDLSFARLLVSLRMRADRLGISSRPIAEKQVQNRVEKRQKKIGQTVEKTAKALLFCPECHLPFNRDTDLNAHLTSWHPEKYKKVAQNSTQGVEKQAPGPSLKKRDGKLTCAECGLSFNRETDFQAHLKNWHG